MKNILFTLLLSLFFFACQSADDPIVVFDLRYTLSADLNDSAQVLSVWDDIHTLSTLQGVVNRENPRLYYFYVMEGKNDIDTYWWSKYRQDGEWLHNRDTIQIESIEELVYRFRDDIQGAVIYDPQVASTSNVASAVAGIENWIAIRYDLSPGSLYDRLVVNGPKLPVKLSFVTASGKSVFVGDTIWQTDRPSTKSTKNDPYIWFIEKYIRTGRANPLYGAYYIDQFWQKRPKASVPNHHTLTNHDFFVSRKAFFFDLSPWGDEAPVDDPDQPIGTDLATLKEMLHESYKQHNGTEIAYIGGFPAWAFKYTDFAGTKHEAVPTEWEFSRIISAYNAFKDADAIGYGAMANASFWQHFPLHESYPQSWVSHDTLKAKGYLTSEGKLNLGNKQLILFYVGDYDASSWISQRTPTLWDDPNRGKLPLMWSISPVLQERTPHVMHNFRATATPNDYFVAADNGAGYLMPGMLQEPREISGLPSGLNAWSNHCKPYYDKWGYTVTGFVIDGFAPGLNSDGLDCYASFSPNGIVPQKTPLAMLHGNMPVLRSDADINENNPVDAANHLLKRVDERQKEIPFHWFRNILKSPTWYVNVMQEVNRQNPNIELVDCPTFFELLRIYLKEKEQSNQ